MTISVCFLLLLSLFSLHAIATATAQPPTVSAVHSFDASSTTTATTPPTAPDHSFFSHTLLLAPILSHLGFTELAMAAPTLSSDSSSTTAWSGPSTLFAPSDSSIRTCSSCSVPQLLREHLVPGLFTIDYLRKLAFGTKIETLSPGRCITVTSSSAAVLSQHNLTSVSASPNDVVKVFIGGVEISHPDLFNNGLLVIHGIRGYVTPLSPFSCDVERMTSLSFPFQPQTHSTVVVADRQASATSSHPQQSVSDTVLPAVTRLMLRDAMLRLRNNGFSILSLAMRVKYPELVALNNITMFALDDVSVFSGSYSYISSIRFHIVPNHYLTMADLERLKVGTVLPTLERGQSLVITTAGLNGGVLGGVAPVRINYVRVKVPDLVRNLKIVVHSVYLPFPRIHPTAAVYDGILGGSHQIEGVDAQLDGACDVLDEHGACESLAIGNPPIPQVEIEDHHGL